jgi:Zn-dependent M16 (insulinase) family peptidase
MFLIAFLKSNKIDLKELENSKNVSLTKKSLFKEEFKDKERIRRLLRQQLTRTRIKVNSK